jgi:HEAT repeat protein
VGSNQGRESPGPAAGPLGVPELSSLLADLVSGEDARAERAALRLPEHGEQGMAALRPLLHSEQADVRWWAVRALSQYAGSDEQTGELLLALADASREVRQCAAMSLSHHPDPRAVSALIRTLADPDPMTAGLARSALAATGAAAVPDLIALLQGPDTPPPARLEAVRALAEIKDPRAIPALMKTFEQDSSLMHYWAEQGLGKLGLGMVYIKPE